MQNKQPAHQWETVKRPHQLNVAYNTVTLSALQLAEICYNTAVVGTVQHTLLG